MAIRQNVMKEFTSFFLYIAYRLSPTLEYYSLQVAPADMETSTAQGMERKPQP
jgi:hypothetical protein